VWGGSLPKKSATAARRRAAALLEEIRGRLN
jgi:hypothetical protein